ncbi:MAG: hypothetical protein PHQ80_02000 [Candidatus ainarchaeum sp.]|nr:hypothetical protein [Candidatus ainarchaeum sp.]
MEQKYGEPERKENVETDMKQFLQSRPVHEFTELWHREGYTKMGIHELLSELYRRFSGDEKKALERGEEILAVLKMVDLSKFKIKPEGLVKAMRKLFGGE